MSALRARIRTLERREAEIARAGARGQTRTPPQSSTATPPPAGESFAAGYALPRKAPPPAVAPACAQFGGFYIGGHGGYGFYDHRFNDRDGWLNLIDLDGNLPKSIDAVDNNWLAGAQAGFNWQRNCTVFGIEADWSWTGLKATARNFDGATTANDWVSVESKMSWFGTVRTRAGVVVDNLLLYVTGGFAYSHFKRDWTFFHAILAAPGTVSANETKWGWTAGVGSEWAWGGNWSIKAEFLYLRFVDDTTNFTAPLRAGNGSIGIPGTIYRFESHDSAWISRIGINYRWGGGVPVVARY